MLFSLQATLEPIYSGLFLHLALVEKSLNPLISHFRRQIPSAHLKELAQKRWISGDLLALAALIQNQGLSNDGINFPMPIGYFTLKTCRPITSKVVILS